MKGGSLYGVTEQFGVSKLKLRARACTQLDGIPMPHDDIQVPQTFHLGERTSEAQRESVAWPELHSNPDKSTDVLIPTPLCPNRSCQAQTLKIFSTVSWVLEIQCPALHSGLLQLVTVASLKICPLTPRTPLHTVGRPPLRSAAILWSLARDPAPPTVLSLLALPDPPGHWSQ